MKNEKIILAFIPPGQFKPEYREKIAEAAGGYELIHTMDKSEIEKILNRIEICIGNGPWDLYTKMPELKWIQTWSAGVEGLMANPALKTMAVKITNTSGIHVEQLTEHIFAMMLAFNKKLKKVFEAQKKHEWITITGDEVPVIAGKAMLILGFGVIGEQCAKAALGFGMKVTGLRRHPPKGPSEIRVEAADKMHSLLPEADYVVNIMPLTHDTKNIFGKKEFSLMKKSAVYVNVGRGLTTDEAALIEALKSGQIAGALLDVTAVEPLSGDSPLWDMENVIITPHFAGVRPDYAQKAMDITLENLRRYKRGEELIRQVDKNAGY